MYNLIKIVKNLINCFVLAVLTALLMCQPARAEKGAVHLGLASHFVWPQMDVAEFEPGLSYGAVFHYWLNDTTSIELGYEYMNFKSPLDAGGEGEHISYVTNIIEGGARYRPELDFIMTPFVEAGIGYQFWSTDPGVDFLDSRSGNSVAYFLGSGLVYHFRKLFLASLSVRWHYMPMHEHIVVETDDAGGNVRERNLRDVSYLSAGIEMVWRLK